MTKSRIQIIIGVVIIIAAIVGISFLPKTSQSTELDGFAQCLTDKGVKFYGAYWCPHCQRQKALFGKSSRLLPYIECSTPDGNGQLEICKEKKIENYPTWIFTDESRIAGEATLQTLSEKTSCSLPE